MDIDVNSLFDIVKKLGRDLVDAKDIHTSFKKNGTEVTELDRRVEKDLRDYLLKVYPKDGVMGEEGEDRKSESGFVWVIDPIDGTRYFANNVPIYAITLARVKEQDEVVFGLIYFPALEIMIHAIEGEGVYKNGKKVEMDYGDMDFENIIPYVDIDNISKLSGKELAWTQDKFQKILFNFKETRIIGSSTFAALNIISGTIHAFFDITGRNPFWDIAAQSLIMKELGFVEIIFSVEDAPERQFFIPAKFEKQLRDLLK